MTDAPVAPDGEPQSAAAPRATGSFGDAAAEMANESEVEADRAADRATDRGADPGADSGPGPGAGPGAGDVGDAELEDDLTRTRRDLTELTSDLQRLQAEYLNYKRRVERDRELIRENATYAALAPIIEVLDTIDRAREHGEIDGGFKSVAEQLERVVARQGLIRFGAPGDAFDPNIHEALSHIGQDPAVSVTTCQHIAKVGYRIGERVVRAAQVLVVDPVDTD